MTSAQPQRTAQLVENGVLFTLNPGAMASLCTMEYKVTKILIGLVTIARQLQHNQLCLYTVPIYNGIHNH